MNFNIGQVLYVMLNNGTKLIPVKVIEEMRKKTLDGEVYTYSVLSPNGKKYNLDNFDGQIFNDSNQAYEDLLERATQNIKMMVDNATNVANNNFIIEQINDNQVDELKHAEVENE